MNTPPSDDKSASTTKMVSPQAKHKMVLPNAAQASEEKSAPKLVKIKAVLAILIGSKTYQPGSVVEVTEEEAAEFCDKSFDGLYEHEGELSTRNAKLAQIKRAVRV